MANGINVRKRQRRQQANMHTMLAIHDIEYTTLTGIVSNLIRFDCHQWNAATARNHTAQMGATIFPMSGIAA
jgi:hypothetical protein